MAHGQLKFKFSFVKSRDPRVIYEKTFIGFDSGLTF